MTSRWTTAMELGESKADAAVLVGSVDFGQLVRFPAGFWEEESSRILACGEGGLVGDG